MGFRHTVKKNNIQNFIEYNEGKESDIVKKIQNLKEDTVKRLIKGFSQEEIKFVDPNLIKDVEKEYFDLIKENNGDIDTNFDYKKVRKDTEKMFKKHEFDEEYIGNFEKISENNLLDTPIKKIILRKQQLLNIKNRGPKEKKELDKIFQTLKLLDNRNIENTKSRTIFLEKSQFHGKGDKFNVQCFYEQDKNGNRNYFSINELLNDLESFGIESGYPKIDKESLNSMGKEFFSVQKFIKLALLKNILSKYRDYQEIVMYGFKDYEKQIGESGYENRTGILAEKLVEWSFRNFANIDEKYDIKVKKASVGEDQKHKVDLIVEMKDKKTGVNIEKELQLTLNENKDVLQNKRIQIERQKRIRKKDIDLLKLELHGLNQKVTLRRNMERPIGGLNDLLSIEDKEFMKETYSRIVEKLEKKISK
ncbi:MAG TPA: hypothetical protein VJ892_04415 [Candidatus Absconditabacterales bacterium]|nr:hypothetical protein [Candidatus Absconditabacterales bacterium]